MDYDESIFYLVREMGDLGIPAAPEAFEVSLEHVREHGLARMSKLEIKALVMAAKLRGRLGELDGAVLEAQSHIPGGCNSGLASS